MFDLSVWEKQWAFPIYGLWHFLPTQTFYFTPPHRLIYTQESILCVVRVYYVLIIYKRVYYVLYAKINENISEIFICPWY